MFVVLVLALQSQAPVTAPPPSLPVSLERIRKGLEEPPVVTLVATEPGMPPRYRVTVQEKLDIERLWREDLPVPSFVRPSRGLVHHDFLGAVTPDLFRGTAQHPCCDVLPAIEKLGSAIASSARKRAASRTKREIKKELEELEKARRAQAAAGKDR
jgi:hypothetical protein